MTQYLVRHASAGNRAGNTDRSDLERALDEAGVKQSQIIVDRLAHQPIDQVLSSAAIRCVQTVQPLAEALGTTVDVDAALMEGQSASAAVVLRHELANTGRNAVLCSHGDIIPDTIQTLGREGMSINGLRGWAKGSIWQLDTRGRDIVAASFMGPF